MLASLNGHRQVVKLLLNEKGDLNIQNNNGWTALMIASQNGHQQVVELLLNEKADPKIQHDDGRSEVMAANENGHQQMPVELLSAPKCMTCNEEKIEGQASHQQNTSQHEKKNQEKHTRFINDDDEYIFQQEKPDFHEKIKVRAVKFVKMGSLISESIKNPFKGKKIVEKRNIN